MIASFTNNFIFLKTAKTASTSAEIVLSSWCAHPDIVTGLSPDEEAARIRLGGRAMNEFDETGKRIFFQHMSAHLIRDRLPELWDKAYKIAVERHPYERAVSLAYWRAYKWIGFPPRRFRGHLRRVIEKGRFCNDRFYKIDGEIVADEVILYEDLWPRIAELARQWGKPMPAAIPNAKSSQRRDRRPAAEILSEEQKAAIRELAAWEFDTFGFAP